MDLNLLNLNNVVRSWGRGVVFRGPIWTPGLGDPLVLTHLGDTEGDIAVQTNAQVEGLTTPELTGAAMHEADYVGENPTVEIPLYLADPTLRALVSPAGSRSGGRSRRSAVAEHTLAIFPEQLFLAPNVAGEMQAYQLEFTAGEWLINGEAIDAAQEQLLGFSVWLWRGFFSRPPITFKGGAGDERKTIETVTFQVMHHPDMPEGHHLYTIGDPAAADIDVEGGS
jgi:hypothetical protein